ncbi:MAG: AMP-binding protein, partial [Georgenia sp.]
MSGGDATFTDGQRPRGDGAAGSAPAADAPGPGPTAADAPGPAARAFRPLYAVLSERADSDAPAVVELTDSGPGASSWSELAVRVHHLALGLADAGVRPGHRVSLLITPGADLTTAAFACLRLGAVVILADSGLGVLGLHRVIRAVEAEAPDHIIGIERAIVAARLLGLPGQKFIVYRRHGRVVGEGGLVDHLPPRTAHSRRRALGIFGSVRELRARGAVLAAAGAALPAEPEPDSDAVILLTGAAAGIVHTHRRLAALRDTVGAQGPTHRLVAGSALYALVGTALGATSAALDTGPAAITPAELARAVTAVEQSALAAPGAAVPAVADHDAASAAEGTVVVLATAALLDV